MAALCAAGSAGCSDELNSTGLDGGDIEDQDTIPLTSSYALVGTNQTACYDDRNQIPCPVGGQAFHGQDAQHASNQPSYLLSADGLTVRDQVTGLTWQRSPDTNGDGEIGAYDKLTWAEAQALPNALNAENFGGYSDWRLPTIKELYSLIVFTGIDPSGWNGDASDLVPFIDTDNFDFAYGDESAGERIIDSQYASSSLYVDGSIYSQLLFGVNFADGRIKGYGMSMPGGREKTFFVACVRGNPGYGTNDFMDHGDGTVTDRATGLMWARDDSGSDAPRGMNWEDALAWVEGLKADGYLGHTDWRMPDVKELQSILDYGRSPSTTGSAAIDPVFNATAIMNEGGQEDYPSYWSSTTHAHFLGGSNAAYVSFGRAMGYMGGSWMDVHGAGAQRSDPKAGDPGDYPTGHGPQGDAIRIYNFVRVVRDGS
ncbi:MAG: DUF1566 domain-containing protein [Gemmatimonadetes bacterium]|nr:DUF1566 domain-containing protein [Gemmatimonadota bacterium]